MLVDCHIHTRAYSACSRIDPEELCSTALERGLGGLVITEHHRWWPEKKLDRLRNGFPGLRIWNGIELTMAEGYDIVLIGPQLGQTPSLFLSMDALLRLLGRLRAVSFLFVAHAFRYVQSMTPQLELLLGLVDGLEMNSVNILRQSSRRQDGLIQPGVGHLYTQALDVYGLAPLFNSDAHVLGAVGAIAGEFDFASPPRDEIELARALKSEISLQKQRADLLERLFSPAD